MEQLHDNIVVLGGARPEGRAPGKLAPFPRHLDIEPTSRCNFNCTFCDKQPLLTPEQLGDMPLGLYKKLIDEGAESGLESVQLCYRGEPLLHPDIVPMVDYAKRAGIAFVYFCTNGTLLTPQKAGGLLKAGLDRVTVSVQGTDEKTFEEERLGANFSLIFRNLQHLLRAREASGGSTPVIRLQAVGLPGLDREAYARFWRPHCDEVSISEYKKPVKRRRGLVSRFACPQPFERMTVEWDGTLLPCYNNDVRLWALGNAHRMKLADAWNGERMARLRQRHLRGESHTVEDCDGCSYRAYAVAKK